MTHSYTFRNDITLEFSLYRPITDTNLYLLGEFADSLNKFKCRNIILHLHNMCTVEMLPFIAKKASEACVREGGKFVIVSNLQQPENSVFLFASSVEEALKMLVESKED